MLKRALVFGLAFGVFTPFYTTFVVQNLWNWFVADAIHAEEISYWQSFGIVILAVLLTLKDESEEQREESVLLAY